MYSLELLYETSGYILSVDELIGTKMKKLVIFDLDGTLLNTIADLAASTNQALQVLGFPIHPVEAYKYFVGNGINKLFERSLPENERTDENIQKVRSLFVPYYDAHNTDLSEPYEGIVDLLQSLQSRGIMLAVASNKYQVATEKLIKYYFPTIHFVSVLGQREGIPVKPDASIVIDSIIAAGVKKEETLYVGDSDVDMQTAQNANVEAVGVTWGFRPACELEAFLPRYIANKAADILNFLES